MSLPRFEWDEEELVVRSKDGTAARIEESVAAQLLEYLCCGRFNDVECLVLAGASRARAVEIGTEYERETAYALRKGGPLDFRRER